MSYNYIDSSRLNVAKLGASSAAAGREFHAGIVIVKKTVLVVVSPSRDMAVRVGVYVWIWFVMLFSGGMVRGSRRYR